MSKKVYVVTVDDVDFTRVFGVFESPMDAVNAVSNDTSGICSGHISIIGCELGAKNGEGDLVFYAPNGHLRQSLDEVFAARLEAKYRFHTVKERYKTAEELFEALIYSHCMRDDVGRGFSAIVNGLFTDEEIEEMYEGGEG